MRKRIMGVVVLLGMSASAASGQTAWDSPLLLPPQPADGLGIFLADMHHGGLGVLATWRSPVWNYGLRAGIAEGSGDDDLAIVGGVDYTGLVNAASAEFPIDIGWVAGAGLGISDGVRVSFPLGLTGGHTFRGQGASFTPYATPRVVLDARFDSDDTVQGEDDDDVGLDFAVDLGLDLDITSGGPFAGTTIRFGATVGDRDAVAIGLVF